MTFYTQEKQYYIPLVDASGELRVLAGILASSDIWFAQRLTCLASTVGKHGDEAKIGKYVKNQGSDYKNIYEDKQLRLFWP